MSIIYLKYSSEDLYSDYDTYFSNLRCSGCGQAFSKEEAQTYCHNCHQPLLADYDLPLHFDKAMLKGRVESMWRYREFLPVRSEENIVSLGEGWTPISRMQHLGNIIGSKQLFLKDEAFNPTGSFKARGLSMAISKAKEYGIKKCAIPTAGNAGGALAAYCAASEIEGLVIMPVDTPDTFKWECKFLNTTLKQVDGTISDCGKELARIKETEDWFDVSTMKEPYRLEGKKTMGYEIAEQMNWELPDVIVYPTGGGTGLIGIWKAFDEMEQMGWISSFRPRMVAVQSDGCRPVVDAFEANEIDVSFYEDAQTVANGLCVPKPFAGSLIMKVLYESKGKAIAISDKDISTAVREIGENEGMVVSPEGAATWAATKVLVSQGWMASNEKVLLLNTGSGYKYLDKMQSY